MSECLGYKFNFLLLFFFFNFFIFFNSQWLKFKYKLYPENVFLILTVENLFGILFMLQNNHLTLKAANKNCSR